jgi:hypothetical protein
MQNLKEYTLTTPTNTLQLIPLSSNSNFFLIKTNYHIIFNHVRLIVRILFV